MTGSFRPHVLREYSLIADRGARGALIGPDAGRSRGCARRRWEPQPRRCSAALFGGRGTYAVTPRQDPWYVWGGYYETGSA